MQPQIQDISAPDRRNRTHLCVVASLSLGIVCALPFLHNLHLTYEWSYPKLFGLQAAVFIAWVGLLLVRAGRLSETLRASRVGLPMAALIAWSALSVLWSRHAWTATKPLVELGALALGVIAFADLLSRPRVRSLFVLVYGLASAVACSLYVICHSSARPPFLEVYPFANPNTGAAFTIVPLTVGFAYAISAAARRVRPLSGIAGFAVALAAGAALLVSHSSAGLIAAAGALVLATALSFRGAVRRLLIEALCLIALLTALWPLLSPELWPREWILSEFGARPALWQGALELHREHPLVGSGIGTFFVEYARVFPLDYAAHPFRSAIVETAHSLPLHIIAEVGLVGLVLALWLVGKALCTARLAPAQSSPRDQTLLIGVVCGGLGMLAQGIVSTELHYVEANVNLVLALAVIGAIAGPRPSPSSLAFRSPPWLRFATPVLLALLFVMVAIRPLLSQYHLHKAVVTPPSRSLLRIQLLHQSIQESWTSFRALEARLLLARTYQEAGYIEPAIAQIRMADQLAPNLGTLRLSRAELALQMGELEEAANAVITFARKDPFFFAADSKNIPHLRAYEIWLDVFKAAAARNNPDIARRLTRPEEAVRLLSLTERPNTPPRFPRDEARKLRQAFDTLIAAPADSAEKPPDAANRQ